MKTEKEIGDLVKAREAELQSLIAQHEKDKNDFLQLTTQRQLKVTHLEGCIAQLRDLLPKEKKKK